MNAFARIMKFSGWTLLVMLMASLVIAGVVVGLVHEGMLGAQDASQWHVILDDDDVSGWVLSSDHGFWHGVGGVLGVAVAVFCLLVVLPIVLVLGVGLPLLLVVGMLAVVVAVAFSPLLVPVLLLVWVLRRQSPASA